MSINERSQSPIYQDQARDAGWLATTLGDYGIEELCYFTERDQGAEVGNGRNATVSKVKDCANFKAEAPEIDGEGKPNGYRPQKTPTRRNDATTQYRRSNTSAFPMPSNQRSHIRVSPDPEKPIQVDINGDNFLEVLKAQDISEGGIRVIVPHKFEGCRTDHLVTVVISLPEPETTTIIVKGAIRHVSGNKFGIQFIELDDQQRSKIRRYIESRFMNLKAAVDLAPTEVID